MFEAMARVDRAAMGFTSIPPDARVRLEWGPWSNYDAMLHVYGKTSRTIAFKRTASGYEWIGEQESFTGPDEFDTPDGTLKESITITYHRVPISGYPLDRVNVSYWGEKDELTFPKKELTLDAVRPWLEKWGYAVPASSVPRSIGR